jgi:MoaA/NifB/PqqE/SkfB family radical SAM enzyme
MNRYPNVLLDLYPYCNAKCTFCSYHCKTRPARPMPEKIIHKVIDEIGASGECIEIMPYYYGEPLLNPTLFQTCDYISEHAPNARISLSTNGCYLTPDCVEKLIGIKTLYFVNFSAYAGTKETYTKLLGLDYDTLGKIKYASIQLRIRRPEVTLCVGATTDPRFVYEADLRELNRMFGNLVHPHTISFNYQHQRPEYTRKIPDRAPCESPFASVVVFCDGKVGLCCFDVNGDLIIGDVNETSLLDATNSDIAHKYRLAHLQGLKDVIPLCRSCTQPR